MAQSVLLWFQAKIEELYSEIMSSKKPADTTEKASDDGEDGTLRAKKSEGETKPSDGADGDDDNENGGDEEDEDESPKPKSFGKVAMANLTTLQANPSQQCLHH
jgi:hypothetical protein